MAVRGRPQAIICSLLDRDYSFISSRTGVICLKLGIFAIWHLRLENCVFSGRIELLLTLLFKIINTRSWIVGPCHIIVFHIVLFKYGSLNFTLIKLILRMLFPNSGLLGIVRSWAYKVEASCSIGCGRQLTRWDTVCDWLWDNS